MTTLTETRHPGGFIKSEANGHRSRGLITVASGFSVIAGEVLGRVLDVGSAAVEAASGNAGNGTAAMHTTETALGVKAGVYTAVCIEPASDGGTFEVFGPDGVSVGTAEVGTLFDGVVKFTISDGGTDFEAGDAFEITVPTAGAAWGPLDVDAIDGSADAMAISFGDYDASSAAMSGVAIMRDAEVVLADLTWPSGITENQKTAAIALLEAERIFCR